VLLPYMILTMYAAMRMVDRRLLMAAAISGASPRQAFLRVFVPVSLHGVAGGSLLVFVLALGFFITPALMGGPQQTMIAMLIATEVDKLFDWGFASALGVVLLLLTLGGTLIFHRLVGSGTLLQRLQ
jgi:putative spermidine/putrescine transport system permease protein